MMGISWIIGFENSFSRLSLGMSKRIYIFIMFLFVLMLLGKAYNQDLEGGMFVCLLLSL